MKCPRNLIFTTGTDFYCKIAVCVRESSITYKHFQEGIDKAGGESAAPSVAAKRGTFIPCGAGFETAAQSAGKINTLWCLTKVSRANILRIW